MELRCCILSAQSDVDALKSRLNQSFTSLEETVGRRMVDVYDTFDWRLHQKGWQLCRRGNRFEVVEGITGRIISGIEVDTDGARRFIWDFPVSDFSGRLAPVLEMRALLPMAAIEEQRIRLNVRNQDDKIVARLEIEACSLENKDLTAMRCRLLPVRGYAKAARRIGTIFDDLKLAPAAVPAVVDLLEQSGAAPGAYSSKVNVSLKPEMPAAEAVRRILENLTTIMHQNFPGVREDIDSEFLHDLRVAVRRARSLLSQMKGVLKPEITADLQRHLKAMGAITGPVRDLDVYLLKKAAYIDQLPEVLEPGILQLFRILQRRRQAARNRMVKAMAGVKFKSALATLDAFTRSDAIAATDGPGGVVPIGELASTAIFKRFCRIIKQGRRINDDAPHERLHALRIDCKKLRYLLEFFISLFPDDQMKKLIKQLKQLQDNLGDFNDLSIQQDFMIRYLETIKPQTAQGVMLAAATGGLITRLSVDQRRVRSQFFSAFEAFNSPENQACFRTLFT